MDYKTYTSCSFGGDGEHISKAHCSWLTELTKAQHKPKDYIHWSYPPEVSQNCCDELRENSEGDSYSIHGVQQDWIK